MFTTLINYIIKHFLHLLKSTHLIVSNETELTKKFRCPPKVISNNTAHTTDSRTHLSIYEFADSIKAGPAINHNVPQILNG